MQTKTDTQISFQQHLAHQYRHGSQKTIDSANQHINVFVKWFEAVNECEFNPSQLTSYDLRHYRQHSLQGEKVSAATWNARLWALRVYCEYIGLPQLTEDLQPQNAGRKTSRHRALTKAEYGQFVRQLELGQRAAVTLFEAQSAARNAAAIGLMLWAGLRVEEVTLLDLNDIQINERSGTVTVRHGKGDKERDVPLNLTVRKALAAWLDLRAATDNQALFNGKGTSRLSTRQLERLVKSIGHHAHVPDVTPHWLRYTFAKRLEANGASIEQVRDLLGHASIETTRRYLSSGYDELQALVEAF